MKLETFFPPATLKNVTLDLIRHGQSTTNLQRVVCGQMDSALSSQGAVQAANLARQLPGYAPDLRYTSPLHRVQQTIAPLRLTKLQVEHALMEVNTGAFSPMFVDEMWAQYPDYKYQGRLPYLAYPDGESLAEALNRIWNWFLKECNNWPKGSHVMVAGHEGTVCALLHGLLNLNLWAYPTFNIPNASVTRITWDETLHMRIAIGHKVGTS